MKIKEVEKPKVRHETEARFRSSRPKYLKIVNHLGFFFPYEMRSMKNSNLMGEKAEGKKASKEQSRHRRKRFQRIKQKIMYFYWANANAPHTYLDHEIGDDILKSLRTRKCTPRLEVRGLEFQQSGKIAVF